MAENLNKLTYFLPKSSLLLALLLIGGLFSCKQQGGKTAQSTYTANDLHAAMQQLTDIIVHDIFSPPVASRVYAYPSLAAYEVACQSSSELRSLQGQLNGEISIPPAPDGISLEAAALQAFIEVGKRLVFSESLMTAFQEELLAEADNASIAYGNEVAKAVIAYANADGYNESRSYSKHSGTDQASDWRPTPPMFMDAIEPHWNQLRTFVLDSANAFPPPPPTPYNLNKNSPFFDEVREVYDVSNSLTEEQKEIASFWDCNPFVQEEYSHLMAAVKKITPGGHWVGITKIACMKEEVDFAHTAEAYAKTTIALADAFISCWDEKYRSNLIRPETVINIHIDPKWQPLLQTPPFPEYTSGHSVISTAAAETLTSIFGDNFAFTDTVEVRYGLPARSFSSFRNACQEAAISRLYGGIHYMPAITQGVEQGKRVGNFIVANLKTRE